jgi:hypothetical protein
MLACVLAWEILQIWQGDKPQVAACDQYDHQSKQPGSD